MKRFISILLVFAALLMFSCAEKAVTPAEADATDAVSTEAETADPNDRTAVKDSLPDDLDFGGASLAVLYRGGFDSTEVYAEEMTGDVVNDAVYKRNSDVMERLNVSFDYQEFGTGTAQEFPAPAKAAIVAGSDDYQLVTWCQYSSLPLALENYFCNLISAPYIDYEKPWWNVEYMNNVTIGTNSSFFLMGDICMSALKDTGCVFFNKDLYQNVFTDPSELYNMVFDGTWTIDKLSERASAVYNDVNGNGKADDGDIFGCEASTIANTEHFALAGGMAFSVRDDEGIPTLTLQTETNVAVAEALYSLYYENLGFRVLSNDNAYLGDSLANVFMHGEILFMPIWLQSSDYLRDMESDYGVLPYPKYSEDMDYRALVHDTASMFSLPITNSENFEASCATVEAMCAENYRYVIPAYYEVALKVKYARDEVTKEMIDLIHVSQVTDFVYAYNYACGSIGTIMRTMLGAAQNNYVSLVTSRQKSVQKQVDKLVELYLGE